MHTSPATSTRLGVSPLGGALTELAPTACWWVRYAPRDRPATPTSNASAQHRLNCYRSSMLEAVCIVMIRTNTSIQTGSAVR
jgi:hypothetical protein